jgi:AraC-like DNA-binding protein
MWTPPMRISSALLDAMRVVEIREPEGYGELVRRRALASNHGSLLYRLREPRRAVAAPGEALSKIGDSPIGGLQLSYVTDRFGAEITFPEAHPLSMCIMTVLEGALHYQPFGSAATTATAGGVLLAQAKPGAQTLSADGTERLNLWVNTQSVVRCLEAMLGRPLDAPLDFAPEQAWPRGAGESLRRLVRYVAEELTDPYSLFAGGVGIAGFEDLVIHTLLEGTTHNYSERLARAPIAAPPHTVQRATAFMRENVFQPLTVEDIAQAAGCSARALAAAFRIERGRTVTSVLRDLRLESARKAFAAGDPALTIREVAARLNFSNPGRFAAFYRKRFGELPLQAQRWARFA